MHHEMRLGSATVRLWLDSVDLKASWIPSRCPHLPAFWSLCELEMRGVLLPRSAAGSKLESLLQGSLDHEKTPVNLSLSSLLGQSWPVTSEAPLTQGLNPAALHSLP